MDILSTWPDEASAKKAVAEIVAGLVKKYPRYVISGGGRNGDAKSPRKPAPAHIRELMR